MRGWDDSKITTSTQYVRGTFDPGLSNGEQMNTLKETMFSLHAGLLWYWNDQAGRPKGQLGLSTRNINRPGHTLFENGQRETVTYIFSGSVNLWEQGRMKVAPSFRYFHYKQSLANIGAMAHYQVTEQVDATVGLWYKTNKSLTAMLQVNQGPFLVAVGFDLDAVQELPAKNNNAFELSLGWRMKRNKKENVISSGRPQTLSEFENPKPVLNKEMSETREEESESVKEEKSQVNDGTLEPIIVQQEEQSEVIENDPLPELTAEEKKSFAVPVNFALGESTLTPKAEAHINELCELLKKYPQYTMTILGHACAIGGQETNDHIAKQRAEEVKLVFIKRGVDEKRIKTISRSFHAPIAPNTTEDGRAQNRRVEIKID
jgi:outer membrane protein OmpA-like peptidoglycan-associated protein